MWILQSILAIYTLVDHVSGTKICSENDVACFTRGAKTAHRDISAGVPGVVKASDPLFREQISMEQPNLRYTLSHPKFSGLKYCNIELFKVITSYTNELTKPAIALLNCNESGDNTAICLHKLLISAWIHEIGIKKIESSFQYNMVCPNITMEGAIVIEGNLDGLLLNGKGDCSVVAYDYQILVQGKYEMKEDNAEKHHLKLSDHKFDEVAKGNVTFNFDDVFKNDVEHAPQILNYFQEHWKLADTVLRQPVLDSFMSDYLDNINAYLRETPVEVIFAQ